MQYTFLEHYLLNILFWNIIYAIYFSGTLFIKYTFLEHNLLNILFWNIIVNYTFLEHYLLNILFLNFIYAIYFFGTLFIKYTFLEQFLFDMLLWNIIYWLYFSGTLKGLYLLCVWGGGDTINLWTINNNCLLDWSLYICV